MAKEIYVLGSINVDLMIAADEMPQQGETIVGHDYKELFGGKGFNQALGLAKLGVNTKFIANLGEDMFKDNIMSIMQDNNLNIDNVGIQPNVATGRAIILQTKGDNRIILDAGANRYMDNKQIDTALSNSQEGYFLCQFEVPIEQVAYGLKLAKDKGLTTVVNPAPVKDITDEMYKTIDILVVNQTEAQSLSGSYPNTVIECEEIAKWFMNKGVKEVVITLGSDGSVNVSEDVFFAPSHSIKVVDSTGAGDSFIAAYLLGKTEDQSNEVCLQYGNYAGAQTCLEQGAQKGQPRTIKLD